jgi:hypothetical protein
MVDGRGASRDTAPTKTDAPHRSPHVTVGHRAVPVVLPRLSDPRFKVSAVIMTLQLLGQTVLGFKVSIAQIAITIAVCALIDFLVTLGRDHMIVWPASGILTGSGVAFILRATGTRHGDWWSLRGIQFFVLAGIVSLLSKYFIRLQGRHLFNPSNVGLVLILLVVGPTEVFPQYLYWGPVGGPVVAAMAVILVGGFFVLRDVRMVGMAASFLVTFALAIAAWAAIGRSYVAVWHPTDITGIGYWLSIVVSPEVLVFAFFMMSDPQTTPRSGAGRALFGALTALLAAELIFFQTTEYGVKLAILSSLTVTCALVPVIDRLARRTPLVRPSDVTSATAGATVRRRSTSPTLARASAVLAAVALAVAAPAGTATLASNPQLVFIERGQVAQ